MRNHRRRLGIGVIGVALGALLGIVPSATAGSLEKQTATRFLYKAAPGEVNNVQVNPFGSTNSIRFLDGGTPAIDPIPAGCAPYQSNIIDCPLPAEVVTVELADGDDKLATAGGLGGDLTGTWSYTVSGGDGNDAISSGLRNDTIDGGPGIDTVLYNAPEQAAGVTSDLTLSTGDSATNADGLIAVENITGSGGSDVLSGDDGANTILGGDDTDTIDGGGGNDTLTGEAGDDKVLGGVGDDTVDGSEDDDEIEGGDGNDALTLGAGDDSGLGDAGNDTINGGDGDDRSNGGDGDDVIGGDVGNDVIGGSGGADRLTGVEGDDTLKGGDDTDRLNGGKNMDKLVGGKGKDVLKGGPSRDRIFAADGDRDKVDCGPGRNETALVDSEDKVKRCEEVIVRNR